MPILRDQKSVFASVDSETKGLYTTSRPRKFFYDEQLVSGQWSEIVVFPDYGFTSISYDLETEGTGTVQVTISTIEAILDGLAIWRDLPENVTINPSVVAMRARCDGATGYFVVRAA